MAFPTTYKRIRDSVVMFFLIVLGVVALGLVFDLVLGRVELSRAGWTLLLAGTLWVVVVGLGYFLWRFDKFEGSPHSE